MVMCSRVLRYCEKLYLPFGSLHAFKFTKRVSKKRNVLVQLEATEACSDILQLIGGLTLMPYRNS